MEIEHHYNLQRKLTPTPYINNMIELAVIYFKSTVFKDIIQICYSVMLTGVWNGFRIRAHGSLCTDAAVPDN